MKNELRIGNYVISGDKIILVNSIDDDGINGDVDCDFELFTYEGYFDIRGRKEQMRGKINLIKPIPLTEEILLKCGFEKIKASSFIEYDKWVNQDGEEILFQAGDGFYHCLIQTENNQVKSLHQLQNLYFALTGEELKINIIPNE